MVLSEKQITMNMLRETIRLKKNNERMLRLHFIRNREKFEGEEMCERINGLSMIVDEINALERVLPIIERCREA